MVIARVLRWTDESTKPEMSSSRAAATAACISPNQWVPPPPGIIKINSDASLSEEGWVGLGVVARNSLGEIVFSATKRLRAWWSVEIAEAKAIEWAIRLGCKIGCKEIIMVSDCQIVVSRLSRSATHLTDLDSVLCDIMALIVQYTSLQWSHVKRAGNEVAHSLAKFLPFNLEQIWERYVPPDVSPYVLMDTLAI
ncbi:uncharacterized protein LOC110726626 [Chenopodium quinoa]|uniref:uncharacterized protein LOC110726626 n=1 Tax=Chenopodium quinoa TaxID=63459 RepID=UPI000B77DAAE|nr:uncharacterized protein LOC110726626 [Chenopodium quinoa]